MVSDGFGWFQVVCCFRRFGCFAVLVIRLTMLLLQMVLLSVENQILCQSYQTMVYS